jgi:hypothetical protein
VQGEKGDVGPQGTTGVQGEKGDVGPQGATGVQGDIGPQGATGEKGEQGDVGPQGATGEKGEQGDVGPQGATGEKGEKGDVGPQGATGVQGEKGDVGPQGTTGVQGEKGDVGPQGATGVQGDIGPQGATGSFSPLGINYGNYLFWNTTIAPPQWDIGDTNINLGAHAGQINQQTNAVAIGYSAGQNNQGTSSIAIGYLAGQTNQAANTIVINATGKGVTGSSGNATYIAPIRKMTQTTAVGYDNTTSEITYYNMTGAGTITPLALTGTTQTLTAAFGNFFQGTSLMPNVTLTGNNIATTGFAFSQAISQGTYTLILPFSGTANSITINAVNTGSYRCNFTNISVTLSGANTRYIILSATFESASGIYFISGSAF